MARIFNSVHVADENDYIFKSGLIKKGVENFWLSNGTNASISNFRATFS
jgi:hypothetical protein